MADINDLIARGITPPQQPDLLGNAGKVAQIGQQRASIAQTQAQTGLIGQESQEAAARTGAIQQQAQGTALENVLKMRHVQAFKTLQGLLRANTVKNPDGTTSTNMPAVLGAYASQFPDYALELQNNLIGMEQKRTELAKSNLGLATAKTQRAGLVMGLGGVGDPNNPVDPQKYAQIKQQAQQEGWDDQLPSVQDYAKNPSAYAAPLAQMVQQSGAKADVLKQQQAQLEATQQQRTLARGEWAQMLGQAGTPQDYARDYALLQQKYPDQFPQLNLIPPSQINSSQALQWAQQAARVGAMNPQQAQDAITKIHQVANLAHLQQAQAAEAGAQANKANVGAAVESQTFQQQYGVNPFTGHSVQPAGATANDSPVVNAPGKGQLDLSKFGPWQSEPPAVRRTALAILGGSPLSGFDTKDPVVTRALNLATKIDPQIYTHEQAQKRFWNDNQNTITAANTAIQHSDELDQYAKQLQQRLPGFVNTPISQIKNQFGSEVQSEFENRRDKYVSEVEKFVHGAGFTEKEADRAIENLSNAKTVGQLLGVVKDNNRMIQQKAQVMNHQYNVQNAGNILGGGVDILQPQTKSILQKQGLIKTATTQNVAGYAQKKGIPLAKAQQEFKDAGYDIH